MISTFAFVFARGGSKGLPRKNILPICGLPLLAHSIKTARELSIVDRIYVSTDCDDIASIALRYGADVIPRPPELATDTASEWLAWQHAINFVIDSGNTFDRFLSLPATAPMRTPQDVQRCLDALHEDIDCVITITPAHRSPWFNMVTADQSLKLRLVRDNPDIKRRQDAPACFDITTLAYVSRPHFILNSSSIWDGTVKGVEVPRRRAIDIDDHLDFSIARFLMEANDQV